MPRKQSFDFGRKIPLAINRSPGQANEIHDMLITRAACIGLVSLLAFTSNLRAGEDYYLLMFGSQRVPANPDYAHSFATFVRATWEGDDPCPKNPTIEAHTISWLPCNGVVRTLALCPEVGRNYELIETMRWCMNNEMRVSLWGAYRIDCELYRRALAQISLLQSGQVRFKAIDSGRSTEKVSNCIHAISTLSQGLRLRVASPGFGESASYFILKELEPWIRDPASTHPWVGSALGLDEFPIVYRDYQNPRSNAIFGPLYRVLGGERNLTATYGPPVPSVAAP
jgi:hypothetical protein